MAKRDDISLEKLVVVDVEEGTRGSGRFLILSVLSSIHFQMPFQEIFVNHTAHAGHDP